MTEHGILFSAPMVLAILAGRKTVTRRIVRTTRRVRGEACSYDADRGLEPCDVNGTPWLTETRPEWSGPHLITSPYGYPGDRLWVRETWAPRQRIDIREARDMDGGYLGQHESWTPILPKDEGEFGPAVSYRASPVVDAEWPDTRTEPRWRPAIHMPRWASRLTLEVVSVRAERLQAITEADILAEGVTVAVAAAMTGTPWSDLPTLHHAWAAGWDYINGDRASWASDPLVWRIEFRRTA